MNRIFAEFRPSSRIVRRHRSSRSKAEVQNHQQAHLQQHLHPGEDLKHYSDLAITTVLVIKHVFWLSLRVTQIFML
ncbi:hypothetical protein AM456_00215 (plasmid) [Escherichia coli]|nr:hypothetical protein AM456_00215 [Escherichia coli]